MTDLLWQATFLLAVAFFFGAVLACGLKRRYYYGQPVKSPNLGVSHTPAPDQPKIEVVPRGSAEGERFSRAISGQAISVAPAQPAPVVAPAPATAPAPAAPAPAAAAAPAPAAWPRTTAPAEPAPTPAPSAPPAAVSVSSGSGAPVPAADGGAAPSDDLTRIRGIDSVLQKQLKELGIRHYRELAALTAADVKGLSDRLGLARRIEQENWLGQAQILATGGETYYSRRVDLGIPVPPYAEPAAYAPAGAAPAPAPKAAEPGTLPRSMAPRGPSDDLTRIRGIDIGIQRQLNELGIRHFQELATLNATDVAALGERLGVGGRIGQENWLGQAEILARGGETYYARRLARTAAAAAPARVAAAAPAASAPVAVQPASAAPSAAAPDASEVASDVVSLRSVRSEALLGAEASRSSRPWSEADDLKRIRGIGVLIEKKLNSLGVTHYEQVANWTGADIERISRILDFKGRIERENWIEQARILATGGQTEFSRRSEA